MRDLIRYNRSAHRHAKRLSQGKRERHEKTLPSEQPINPPTRDPLSVEQAMALFDQHFARGSHD